MSRNLIAYFAGKPDCAQYTLKIISDSANTNFDEILLAGDSPFVVTYDTSRTPFEPSRASRASINVVASDYLFDVYSEDAHGTSVVLYDSNQNVIWAGWLTSNLLSMPQDKCGLDTFTLEAQDNIYTLDKFDYHTIGSHKAIVSFKDIIKEIMDTTNLNTFYYHTNTTRSTGGSYVYLQDYTISEQNFFSSDTDEPWNLRDVLDEMCRYLGYTAIQYQDALYLFDMQYYTNVMEFAAEGDRQLQFNGCRYDKSNWNNGACGTFYPGQKIYLRQSIVRGTGSDISLETIYNKVQVKDSFYEIEQFIPDMFKEDRLTNRLGDMWKSNGISYSGKFTYLSPKGRPKKEEKDENEHVYYMRKYDSKDYEPVYRDPDTMYIEDPVGGIRVSNLDFNQQSDLVRGNGTYDVTATLTNLTNSRKSVRIGAELKYTWYNGYQLVVSADTSDQLKYINGGSSINIALHRECGFNPNFNRKTSFRSWYIVDGVEYDLTDADQTKQYVGGTMVDLATFDKPMDTQKYNYETEASIDFTKYLMIHQLDKPYGIMHPYWNWFFFLDLDPLPDTQIEQYFPCIYKLKSDYYNPMIIDDKVYLAIDASAIWERYNVEYINPDWTHDNSANEGLGLFRKNNAITTTVPALIFKLKVGNKYFSTQSGWTTRDCCFVVNMSTDKTDEDNTDFSSWWNEDHTVLNNVEWSDWAGAKGFKIPLDPSFDFNQPIEFQIHLPSKIQCVDTEYTISSMNNYCWIKSLDVQFATKGSENYDLSDVLYQNVIDSGSVNTLSDINCKFTTYPGEGKHSYSNVALDGQLINNVIRLGLNGAANKPEENIIKAYTNEYHTPTIKQTMTLKSYITPLSIIKDPVLGRYFGIIGTTIDYANDNQTMTLIELKAWDNNLDNDD